MSTASYAEFGERFIRRTRAFCGSDVLRRVGAGVNAEVGDPRVIDVGARIDAA